MNNNKLNDAVSVAYAASENKCSENMDTVLTTAASENECSENTDTVLTETVSTTISPEERVMDMLSYKENGMVKQTTDNCVVALENDPILGGKLHFNELTELVDLIGDVSWDRNWTTLDDVDISFIICRLEAVYGLCSESKIKHAITIAASRNHYHPIRDILNDLVWDGTERVKHALHHFFGTEETELSYESLKLFMLGAVSRIFSPGIKFDTMLCLIGKLQGSGKSTFFRFLAIKDEYFTDDIKRLDDERIFQKIQGHWIIEMPEMLATINAKNIEEIKSFLSRQKDVYRIPYQQFAKDRPRQCVFGGTSNKKQFLPADRTGNRRLIPVEVHPDKAEVHILDNEKESRAYILQMWAEIMEIYRAGDFKLTLSKKLQKELAEYQDDFAPEDIEENLINSFLDSTPEEYVCVSMIFHEALNHSVFETPTKIQSRTIAEVLDNHEGWKRSSTHSFRKYGIQKAWKRNTDENGFQMISNNGANPFS